MINRIGLVFFILGCLGSVQEQIKPSESSGWLAAYLVMAVVGVTVFILVPQKDGE